MANCAVVLRGASPRGRPPRTPYRSQVTVMGQGRSEVAGKGNDAGTMFLWAGRLT